jgi:hypothetical protein
MTYTGYTAEYGMFVNQGINLLYIVFGGLAVYPRVILTNDITPEMWAFPHKVFMCMGLLDSLGTFFTAMGTAYTPGPLQPLLNQTLIPFTMVASFFFLGTRYLKLELVGALCILLGACVSCIPNLTGTRDDSRWYAILLYFCSNIPMACSAVYKEMNFNEATLDVWFLTQWVSIYQFLISFCYLPMLLVPGFGSKEGMTWTQVGHSMSDGFNCYLEVEGSYVTDSTTGLHVPCSERGTFWLLTGYCAVNIMFNTLGLYLTKVGTATLQSLAYALLLPLTTVTFCAPMLGWWSFTAPYKETLSGFTLLGLVLVMAGFGIYQHFTNSVGGPEEEGSRISSDFYQESSPAGLPGNSPAYSSSLRRTKQACFQERVIGMGKAHGSVSFSGSFLGGESPNDRARSQSYLDSFRGARGQEVKQEDLEEPFCTPTGAGAIAGSAP